MKRFHPIARFRRLLGADPKVKKDIYLKTVELGDYGASWVVSPSYLNTNSTVYSFGVGENISFELELCKLFQGINVCAFDPTPRAISWMKKQSIPQNFVFRSWGLGEKDGLARFEKPIGKNVSFRYSSKSGDQKFKILTYKTILNKIGHRRVDLMKMDIEGFEYGVVKNLDEVDKELLPKQLLVEFHHRFSEFSKEDTMEAVSLLRGLGYRLFNITYGQEYSFLLI